MLITAAPAAAPATAAGQADSLCATIRGGEERAWLTIIDRNGSVGGQLSERGILQRFDDQIDDRYFLDGYSAAFSFLEDCAWYRSDNGARWTGGSVDHRFLFTEGELKARVPVSRSWSIGARFNKVDNPVEHRAVLRASVHKRFARRFEVFSEGHLSSDKPGIDIGLGVAWRDPAGVHARFAVTLLDAPSNWIYLTVGVAGDPGTDSTVEYEALPVAVRTAVSIPLSRAVRVEGYGIYVRPITVLAYEGYDKTAGLRQDERYGALGGMLEWKPVRPVVAGLFATTVRARTEREPLSALAPVPRYQLTERTSEVGVFGTVRIRPRLLAEGWLRRSWRPELRVFTPDTGRVDFDLRAFNAQSMLTYAVPGGFTADVGVAWNYTRAPRGNGQVPAKGDLPGIHYRLRADLGWSSPAFRLLLGGAMDFDGEGKGRSFGGARGRFMLFW